MDESRELKNARTQGSLCLCFPTFSPYVKCQAFNSHLAVSFRFSCICLLRFLLHLWPSLQCRHSLQLPLLEHVCERVLQATLLSISIRIFFTWLRSKLRVSFDATNWFSVFVGWILVHCIFVLLVSNHSVSRISTHRVSTHWFFVHWLSTKSRVGSSRFRFLCIGSSRIGGSRVRALGIWVIRVLQIEITAVKTGAFRAFFLSGFLVFCILRA